MPDRIGFRVRAVAMLIDIAAVLLASLLFGPWLGFRLGLGSAGGGPGTGGMMAAAIGGSALIGLLYFASEAWIGVTAGKWVLGLRIGTDDGYEAPREVYVLRWALKHAPTLLAFLAVVVSLWLPGPAGLIVWLSNLVGVVVVLGCLGALGESKQALHDRIAGTAVYRRATLVPLDSE